ncbi:hypothetical protein CAOG_08113 [Capsaspora owczarzaki ATCC 30864]|uniref:Serine protease n=1 Tax=Capsaspora owczarzaki (strain ATCC 30864) TaxID=595528 RepID=A0A0D2W1D3_CAPO3|nr:hypothetical protein CAOG_08113 [Capsaspora owczarzaki ATCC 30864]KJE98087.1 hypothetical protein CAOG_008113 [Capsaspora owczarzaki ATCC 30864]|eukprot:XP_004342714.1 hypothetical protein CAOG_08113 [Capsaspora owczarzaki ATCC 30864]
MATLSSLPEYAIACSKSREIVEHRPDYVAQIRNEVPKYIYRRHPGLLERLSALLDATVIFAQDHAGTGVCVSKDGLILTCAHCLDDETIGARRIVLFPDGRKCVVECVAKDDVRDCALMRVVQVDRKVVRASDNISFPFASLASQGALPCSLAFCIGQPASDDEASNYPLFFTSRGVILGYQSSGEDLHRNDEIGQLIHSCWTYWGHSGAPIVNEDGLIVGMHSSWDDKTNRHGIPLEAIRAFMKSV